MGPTIAVHFTQTQTNEFTRLKFRNLATFIRVTKHRSTTLVAPMSTNALQDPVRSINQQSKFLASLNPLLSPLSPF